MKRVGGLSGIEARENFTSDHAPPRRCKSAGAVLREVIEQCVLVLFLSRDEFTCAGNLLGYCGCGLLAFPEQFRPYGGGAIRQYSFIRSPNLMKSRPPPELIPNRIARTRVRI
jgi:hypothetical protein